MYLEVDTELKDPSKVIGVARSNFGERLWNLKKKLIGLYLNLSLYGRSRIDWTRFREAIQAA